MVAARLPTMLPTQLGARLGSGAGVGPDLYVNNAIELDALLQANGVDAADVVSTTDAIWPTLTDPDTSSPYANADAFWNQIYAQGGILKQDIVDAIPSGFSYYSAVFDGINDFLSKSGLGSIADGKQGTLSFWVKMGSGSSDGTQYTILQSTGERVRFRRESSNKVRIRCEQTTGSTAFVLDTLTDVIKADGWVHLVSSWDLSDTAKRHLYRNGVDDMNVVVWNDVNIDYTTTTWALGASDSGSSKTDGLFCEFFFIPEYIDLSQASNRDFFYDAGKPSSTILDAFTNDPKIYQNQNFPNWPNNQGDGGAWTENGSLGDGGADIP